MAGRPTLNCLLFIVCVSSADLEAGEDMASELGKPRADPGFAGLGTSPVGNHVWSQTHHQPAGTYLKFVCVLSMPSLLSFCPWTLSLNLSLVLQFKTCASSSSCLFWADEDRKNPRTKVLIPDLLCFYSERRPRRKCLLLLLLLTHYNCLI